MRFLFVVITQVQDVIKVADIFLKDYRHAILKNLQDEIPAPPKFHLNCISLNKESIFDIFDKFITQMFI